MIERGGNQEGERMRERREKERTRERSPWKERVYRERESAQEDAGLRVRRGVADAGFASRRFPQTRGSRPAFK